MESASDMKGKPGEEGRLLLFMLLMSWCVTVHAGMVSFGSILPGNGLIHKNLVSMNERKYLNLIRQETDYSCGAAALATILKFGYGIDTNEQKVLQGMFKVADAKEATTKGFSMLNMKNYLKTLRMRGRGYRASAAKLERIRMPVIVLLNLKGYSHFVVFKEARDGKVYIADPALGNTVVEREEFVAGWNGVVFAIIREDFNRNSVLLALDAPLLPDKKHMLNLTARQVPIETGNIQVRQYLTCEACF